ncbi:CLUMA_CG001670, isoform A [Clunio marinus]|uniref:CLUMA_CG001670, isoform A n=1 Tax=Clunio marinus TaxID=568069 RepID=A0A1J1HIY9_9DIPT|nr:CLUMA_CG001670, isoform A [Clunio marinus]
MKSLRRYHIIIISHAISVKVSTQEASCWTCVTNSQTFSNQSQNQRRKLLLRLPLIAMSLMCHELSRKSYAKCWKTFFLLSSNKRLHLTIQHRWLAFIIAKIPEAVSLQPGFVLFQDISILIALVPYGGWEKQLILGYNLDKLKIKHSTMRPSIAFTSFALLSNCYEFVAC